MRLPILFIDAWEVALPNTNQLDATVLSARSALKPGDAAKLIFRYSVRDKTIAELTENMWVTIVDKIGEVFIGVLFNEPENVQHSTVSYVAKGAEVPFLAEHVIDVQLPPAGADVEKSLSKLEVTHTWRRDERPVTNADKLLEYLKDFAYNEYLTANVYYPTAATLLRNGYVNRIRVEDPDPKKCMEHISLTLANDFYNMVVFGVSYLLPTKEANVSCLIIEVGEDLKKEPRMFHQYYYGDSSTINVSELKEGRPRSEY